MWGCAAVSERMRDAGIRSEGPPKSGVAGRAALPPQSKSYRGMTSDLPVTMVVPLRPLARWIAETVVPYLRLSE